MCVAFAIPRSNSVAIGTVFNIGRWQLSARVASASPLTAAAVHSETFPTLCTGRRPSRSAVIPTYAYDLVFPGTEVGGRTASRDHICPVPVPLSTAGRSRCDRPARPPFPARYSRTDTARAKTPESRCLDSVNGSRGSGQERHASLGKPALCQLGLLSPGTATVVADRAQGAVGSGGVAAQTAAGQPRSRAVQSALRTGGLVGDASAGRIPASSRARPGA
jgi:hypothetical protein